MDRPIYEEKEEEEKPPVIDWDQLNEVYTRKETYNQSIIRIDHNEVKIQANTKRIDALFAEHATRLDNLEEFQKICTKFDLDIAHKVKVNTDKIELIMKDRKDKGTTQIDNQSLQKKIDQLSE